MRGSGTSERDGGLEGGQDDLRGARTEKHRGETVTYGMGRARDGVYRLGDDDLCLYGWRGPS